MVIKSGQYNRLTNFERYQLCHRLQTLFAFIFYQHTDRYFFSSSRFDPANIRKKLRSHIGTSSAEYPHLHSCPAGGQFFNAGNTVSNETPIMGYVCCCWLWPVRFQNSRRYIHSDRHCRGYSEFWTNTEEINLLYIGWHCELNVQSSSLLRTFFSLFVFCSNTLDLWHINHELNYFASGILVSKPSRTVCDEFRRKLMLPQIWDEQYLQWRVQFTFISLLAPGRLACSYRSRKKLIELLFIRKALLNSTVKSNEFIMDSFLLNDSLFTQKI